MRRLIRSNGLPFRAMGSMPPPFLPQSARHATAPPDWIVSIPDDAPASAPVHSGNGDMIGVRRYRSVTPSAYSNPNVPPAPSGWGETASASYGNSHNNPSNASSQNTGYSYSYWRPPSSGVPYPSDHGASAGGSTVMGSAAVGESPVMGYATPGMYDAGQHGHGSHPGYGSYPIKSDPSEAS